MFLRRITQRFFSKIHKEWKFHLFPGVSSDPAPADPVFCLRVLGDRAGTNTLQLLLGLVMEAGRDAWVLSALGNTICSCEIP